MFFFSLQVHHENNEREREREREREERETERGEKCINTPDTIIAHYLVERERLRRFSYFSFACIGKRSLEVRTSSFCPRPPDGSCCPLTKLGDSNARNLRK
jgi:hypothetical protein